LSIKTLGSTEEVLDSQKNLENCHENVYLSTMQFMAQFCSTRG